jgi:hypothetical protein
LNEGWITRVGPLPRPVEGLRPPICSDQKLASAVLMYLDSLQPGDRPMLSVYERFRNSKRRAFHRARLSRLAEEHGGSSGLEMN